MIHENAQAQRAQSIYSTLLIAFFSVMLLVITTDFIAVIVGQGRIFVILHLAFLLPMIVFILLYFKSFLRGVSAMPELSLLVFLALLSFIWSYNPANTIERAIPLIVTSAFALTLASVLSLRSLIILFAITGALTIYISLFAVATVPAARGVPPWEDTWNGIFNHKNGLGANSMYATIVSVGAYRITNGKVRRFFLITAFASAFMLIASESRSPQIVAILSFGALLIYTSVKRFTLIWAIGYLATIVIIVASIIFMMSLGITDPIFDALERKPTLSGRIPLWKMLGPYMMDEFWLGYGYKGFWEENSERVLLISGRGNLGFIPFYSHNGLIETWLNMGFVGVVVLFSVLFRTFHSCFTSIKRMPDRSVLIVPFLILIAFLLTNVTEGSVLSRTSLSWMIFVAFATKISIISKTLHPNRVILHKGFCAIAKRSP